MPINCIIKPVSLNKSESLVKTIRFRNNRDYWNTFLKGVLQDTNDPVLFESLAHLHLRKGPRTSEIKSTYGMEIVRKTQRASESESEPLKTPDEQHTIPSEAQYIWKHRPLVPNTNPDDPRTVIHQSPMYTPEEKKGYSKHQSTTLVAPNHSIHPCLFGGFQDTELQPMSGVFFPLKPDYYLVNRWSIYDGATVCRPYDKIPEHTTWANARTFNECLSMMKLKGGSGQYSEVLARLKMCKTDTFGHLIIEDPTLHQTPGLLMCVQQEYVSIQIETMFITLKRAFDLLLCLRRQYGINPEYCVPIIIYNYQNSLFPYEKVIYLKGTESLSEVFSACIPNWDYAGRFLNGSSQSEQKIRTCLLNLFYHIVMQQNIYGKLSKLPISSDPPCLPSTIPWYHYLSLNSSLRSGELFYLETLMSLVTLCAEEDHELVSVMSPEYKKIINKFLAVYHDKAQLRQKYINFALKADFELTPYEIESKINPRFPVSISPNFPHSKGMRPLSFVIKKSPNLIELQKQLETPGVKINKKDLTSNGRTPLMHACYSPNIPDSDTPYGFFVQTLLNKPEINLSIKDNVENTTLMHALVGCRHLPIIQQIVQSPQTEINALNNDLLSALYLSTYSLSNDYICEPTHDPSHTSLPDKRDIFKTVLSRDDIDVNIATGPKKQTIICYLLHTLNYYLPYYNRNVMYITMMEPWNVIESIKKYLDCQKKILWLLENKPSMHFDDNIFNVSCIKIKQAALKRRRSLNNELLSPFETNILKGLPIEQCTQCQRPLGITTRKHHCRKCMEGFCHRCILEKDKQNGEWCCQKCLSEIQSPEPV